MGDNPVFWKVVVSGGTAGVAEIVAMYPTDVAKTRAQISKTRLGMVSIFRTILQEQGPSGLYRGIMTPILAEAPKRAWKFGANDQFKKVIGSATGQVGVKESALAGSLAGISEALVNCPFETVKVRMQDPANISRFANSSECLKALVREEGVLALYKGLEPQMWRNGLWNGLYFGSIGFFSIQYPLPATASKEEKLMYKFVSGVVGSSIGTIANTPFDVVKSRMQQQMGPGPDGQLKYRNTLQSLQVIAAEEGTAALYKGLGPRLVRLGPGGGIMIVAFEFMNSLLKDF